MKGCFEVDYSDKGYCINDLRKTSCLKIVIDSKVHSDTTNRFRYCFISSQLRFLTEVTGEGLNSKVYIIEMANYYFK